MCSIFFQEITYDTIVYHPQTHRSIHIILIHIKILYRTETVILVGCKGVKKFAFVINFRIIFTHVNEVT